MSDRLKTPDALRVRATLSGTRAVLERDGFPSETATAVDGQDLRIVVIEHLTRVAGTLGCDIALSTAGDRGEHLFLITATGEVTSLQSDPEDVAPVQVTHDIPVIEDAAVADPEPAEQDESVIDVDEPNENPSGPWAHPVAPGTSNLGLGAEETPIPGWRGIARSRIQVKRRASAQPAADEDRRVVAQHWPGCRKVAVVSGMGGQGRTMTTQMIAAVFGRLGGGAVLAWDNSDTLGTLGWRTERGSHNATAADTLVNADRLLDPSAGVSTISGFVHHQTEDHYDVLRKPAALFGLSSPRTAEDVDRLLAIAERYYRMLIVDNGLNETGMRVLDEADQLIVPVRADVESAEGALLFLEQLRGRDARAAHLAENAVVLLTKQRPVDARTTGVLTDALSRVAAEVEVLAFDPALGAESAQPQSLRRATKDTFLRVAAHAARRMTT
jgi:MinD-like ATPase involved in chromosome partitioning or flagellar assembly